MQSQNNVVRAYEKEGIVLIDEIETHLHLELQRVILPILTTIFLIYSLLSLLIPLLFLIL